MMLAKKETKIYAVDDDPNNLELIEDFLSSEQCRVVTEESSVEAMNHIKIQGQDYDLFILDWSMPEIDGIEILSYLKNNKNLKRKPVIMQTARSEPSDIRVGLDFGAVHYLIKPFDLMVLKAMVQNALNNQIEKNSIN